MLEILMYAVLVVCIAVSCAMIGITGNTKRIIGSICLVATVVLIVLGVMQSVEMHKQTKEMNTTVEDMDLSRLLEMRKR